MFSIFSIKALIYGIIVVFNSLCDNFISWGLCWLLGFLIVDCLCLAFLRVSYYLVESECCQNDTFCPFWRGRGTFPGVWYFPSRCVRISKQALLGLLRQLRYLIIIPPLFPLFQFCLHSSSAFIQKLQKMNKSEVSCLFILVVFFSALEKVYKDTENEIEGCKWLKLKKT